MCGCPCLECTNPSWRVHCLGRACNRRLAVLATGTKENALKVVEVKFKEAGAATKGKNAE